MRLIDVAIPTLGQSSTMLDPLIQPSASAGTSSFPLAPTLFPSAETEYHLDEVDDDEQAGSTKDEQFFEASDSISEVCLQASILGTAA